MTLRPLLSSTVRDGQVELAATGAWTAVHAKELEPLVEGVARETPSARTAAINMREVEEFDTYGAWLLERLIRAWQARGQNLRILELPGRYQGLLAEVHRANREARVGPPRESKLLLALEVRLCH